MSAVEATYSNIPAEMVHCEQGDDDASEGDCRKRVHPHSHASSSSSSSRKSKTAEHLTEVLVTAQQTMCLQAEHFLNALQAKQDEAAQSLLNTLLAFDQARHNEVVALLSSLSDASGLMSVSVKCLEKLQRGLAKQQSEFFEFQQQLLQHQQQQQQLQQQRLIQNRSAAATSVVAAAAAASPAETIKHQIYTVTWDSRDAIKDEYKYALRRIAARNMSPKPLLVVSYLNQAPASVSKTSLATEFGHAFEIFYLSTDELRGASRNTTNDMFLLNQSLKNRGIGQMTFK